MRLPCYNLVVIWACGSVVERRPDKTKVNSSILFMPTLESVFKVFENTDSYDPPKF